MADDIDDPDNPELTEADFARGGRSARCIPSCTPLGSGSRGRPKVVRPKAYIGFRFAADIVDSVKASGKGYNGRVEKVLRDALARGLI